jgi:endonuclease-3
LFRVANSPRKILKLSEKQIAKLIYPAGFYRQKAKKIKKLCRILLEKYRGKVPKKKEELLSLLAVGNKTASIVLAYGFGIPTIAVDTHVNRISKRLGIVPDDYKPEETQKILEEMLPKKLHIVVNHLLVTFGKNICRPVKPRCEVCPIKKYCKYYRIYHI